MIKRREILKAGALTPLLLTPAAQAALAQTSGGQDRPQAIILDRRFGEAILGFAPDLPRHVIDGDVTQLWVETLNAAWRKPGFALAGATGADMLFILERFAWDRGRRVVQRNELAPQTSDRPALVHWLIVPVHPSMKV